MKNGITIILIIIIAILWSENQELKNKNINLSSEVDYLESRVSDYTDALEEANSNIDQANSNIEDANGYAWSTYQEMGEALDNLDTVDNVSEP